MWSTKSVVPSLRLLLIMCSAAEVIGIIGGRYARLGMFPHHVSLHVEETYIASGALVSELFVLTCAHCILDDRNTYTVLIGVVDLKDTGGQTFLPKEFIIHPNYNHETFDYDIGLIRLSRPAVIDEKVQIIGMAPGTAIYPKNTMAIVTGYGDIDPYKTRQDCLKYVYVPLWSQKDCQSPLYNLTDHGNICAGDDDGRNNPCQGDSGGGLVVNYILIGVYFAGASICGAPHSPGVYQSVPYHRKWIDEVMKSQFIRKKKNFWNNSTNDHNVRHKNCNHFNSTRNP